MDVFWQIAWGSLVLGLCVAVHIACLIVAIPATQNVNKRFLRSNRFIRSGTLIATVVVFIVFAHTVQVWLWAGCFLMLEVLMTFEEAIYFSLVTYTTVGYGDVTIEAGFRIFGAMASVTGLLTFGLSTAFLVTFFEQIKPKRH